METPAEGATQVQHIQLKAPQFCESALNGWFTIFEGQFSMHNIRLETTKFYHVLTSLPATTVDKLPTSVLQSKNYAELKASILSFYEDTKAETFEKFIQSTPLTGRPSLYLQEMTRAADKVGVSHDLVRHKFTQALPNSLSAVLATQKEIPLPQLGKLADEIMPLINRENAADTATCHAVQQNRQYSPPQNNFPNKKSPHINNRENNGSIGLRPFYSGQRQKICRAHLFFGQEARTCKPWCRWPTKNRNLVMQPNSRPVSPIQRRNPTQTQEQRSPSSSPSAASEN